MGCCQSNGEALSVCNLVLIIINIIEITSFIIKQSKYSNIPKENALQH